MFSLIFNATDAQAVCTACGATLGVNGKVKEFEVGLISRSIVFQITAPVAALASCMVDVITPTDTLPQQASKVKHTHHLGLHWPKTFAQ